MPTTADVLLSFGEKIRRQRERSDLTRDDVYYATGFNESYIADVEEGRNQNPHLLFIYRVCRLFGWRVRDQFFNMYEAS